MPDSWADLFGQPGRLPLSAATTPADVQAMLGPPSAAGGRGRTIKTLEYWPELLGVLWVFSWQGPRFLSAEANFQNRGPGLRPSPRGWVGLLSNVPDNFERFLSELHARGYEVGPAEETEGWLLLRTGSPGSLAAEAKFCDRRLYSIYFH